MQYLMLIYENEADYGGEKGGEALNRVVADHMAFGQGLGAKRLGGAGLKSSSTATTLRASRDGTRSLHDGPFAEAKEQLGGYYLVEADDLDDAIAIARRMPLVGQGAVEIRPLLGQS